MHLRNSVNQFRYTEAEFTKAISAFYPKVTKMASGAGHEGFHKATNRTMFVFQR